MKARRRSGNRGPTTASSPSAKAVSVDIATPQPCAEPRPTLQARYTAIATAIPPSPASTGSKERRRSRSSPRSSSRLASSPSTKKKNVISPLEIHARRSIERPWSPSATASVVPQTDSYDEASTFTQTSAASAAASRTAAPPVSVRRNDCSGVRRLRTHAVRPVNADAGASVTSLRALVRPPLLLVSLDDLGRPDGRRVGVEPGVAQSAPLAEQVPALVERDLQLLESTPLGLTRAAGGFALPQLVLLRDEGLDPRVDLRFVHGSSSAPSAYDATRPGGSPRSGRLFVRCDDERDLVDEAPAPRLSRLGGARDRMADLRRVPARVAVRRRVAAA